MQFLRRIAQWQVPLSLALVCTIAAAYGDDAREMLRYERGGIAAGDFWRLLSGHIVHLGRQHLQLNLIGLLLVWALVGRLYNTREWMFVMAICVLTMGAGFWFFDPAMHWYVGLSGILHGLLLAGAIRGVRALQGESVVVCTVIAVKLAYEQVLGPLPGTASMAGGPVIVNAHLYGAIGGALAALALWRRVRAPGSI